MSMREAWKNPPTGETPDFSGAVVRSQRYRSAVTDASLPAPSNASTPCSTAALDSNQPVWQWEHRTGYKNYDRRAQARIEEAFQQGYSRCRLKAGKLQDTPMELFFYDMIQFDPKTGNTRKIRRIGPNTFWDRLKRRVQEMARLIETGRTQRFAFAQYEQKRKELHRGMDRPDYDVSSYYHDTGCCASIAKSNWFFAICMAVVGLNSFWIGIEADYNTAPTLTQADVGFQLVEHAFCTFFFSELAIRFGAFRRKRHCVRDAWFCFDSTLVVLMVGETWILPITLILIGQTSGSKSQTDYGVKGLSILSTIRLLRLTRLGRIARLLRAVPEVLTLLKGIAAAMRSVFFTLILLLVLLYVFGVVFKTQSEEDEALRSMFPTVPAAMWVLLLSGTLLDGPSGPLNDVGATSPCLAMVFIVFIFLSSFMVLNMLIGILCDVVHQVALNEKEEAAVQYLKNTLLEILECHDKDNDRQIHRDEFELLMRNPEMHYILTRFGVNVVDLISLKDVLFEDKDAAIEAFEGSLCATREFGSPVPPGAKPLRKLSFGEFLEVVLRLRGGNAAMVTDIVELREYVRQRLDRMDIRINGGDPRGQYLRSLRSMKSGILGPGPSKPQVLFEDKASSSEEQPQLPGISEASRIALARSEQPQLPAACISQGPSAAAAAAAAASAAALAADLKTSYLHETPSGAETAAAASSTSAGAATAHSSCQRCCCRCGATSNFQHNETASLAQTLLERLQELAVGQQEILSKQSEWQRSVVKKQDMLAADIKHALEKIELVTRVLDIETVEPPSRVRNTEHRMICSEA
eukprot:TRINITY_DN3352_c2_g1_i1.p1 TRINITY_DN3352_c2_g1~~TRINITY_DN3352_c2_g1_i1.p1  ORF type:complete len:806 (+),score=130.17 TRINITY_DN3352_c2_g1_i1:105-2522(+)